jgi:hypothetical protein
MYVPPSKDAIAYGYVAPTSRVLSMLVLILRASGGCTPHQTTQQCREVTAIDGFC